MLQGLEDMLVHLTDAADRAHSSNRFVQGLKLRSKKSTKARAFAVAAHSVNSPQIEWRKAPPRQNRADSFRSRFRAPVGSTVQAQGQFA
jgi:hypothetical protein